MSDDLPFWTVERTELPVEAAPVDAPFRTAGRTVAPVTLAMVQSRLKPNHTWPSVIAFSILAVPLSGVVFLKVAPLLALVVGVASGALTFLLQVQPRVELRATPDGIEVRQGRRLRRQVARREVERLTVERDAYRQDWLRLEAIGRDGTPRPLVVSRNRVELVAIGERVAAHLGLTRG